MAPKDIIEVIFWFFSGGLSILALVRSSKVAQNLALTKTQEKNISALNDISNKLELHIVQDANDIAVLKTNHFHVNEKLDRILDKLEK
jgi:hypothetical protein